MLSVFRRSFGIAGRPPVQVGVAQEGENISLMCLSGKGVQRRCRVAVHAGAGDTTGAGHAPGICARDSLQALVQAAGCQGLPAVTCLDAPAVISAKLSLDAGLSPPDREDQVRFELAAQAGLPEPELACDFVVLDAGQGGEGNLTVQAWGARQHSIDQAFQWLENAGLQPRAIEPSCLARQRACLWWLQQEAAREPLRDKGAVFHLVCEPGQLRLNICPLHEAAPPERVERRNDDRLQTVLGQALWLLEEARSGPGLAPPGRLLLTAMPALREALIQALREQLACPVEPVCAWMGLKSGGEPDSERSFELACGLALWQGSQ